MATQDTHRLPRLAGDPGSWRVVAPVDTEATPPRSLYEALQIDPGIPVGLRQDLQAADQPVTIDPGRLARWTFIRVGEQLPGSNQNSRNQDSSWLARLLHWWR